MVRHRVKYDTPDENGTTLRQHMIQARRDIEEPEIPPAGFHILEWFWTLDAGRSANGFGVNPISYPDILAWAALSGAEPEPWEVAAIKTLDMAMLGEIAAVSK